MPRYTIYLLIYSLLSTNSHIDTLLIYSPQFPQISTWPNSLIPKIFPISRVEKIDNLTEISRNWITWCGGCTKQNLQKIGGIGEIPWKGEDITLFLFPLHIQFFLKIISFYFYFLFFWLLDFGSVVTVSELLCFSFAFLRILVFLWLCIWREGKLSYSHRNN